MSVTHRLKAATGLIVAIAIGAVLLAGCNDNSSDRAQNHDRAVAGQQLAGFQKNQPVPVFDWSQLRQNLIEIETAQARTTQTTSFFFNMGVADPVDQCPSVGFPIPATYQLDNPQAKMRNNDVVLPQIEANGVYTADTTGTYVMCIDAQGRPYANYWEGYVKTIAGPAKWDTASHSAQLIGPPSFTFTKGKK